MFTRLDMEHNARALKRGLHERRLSYEEYDQVCEKMDDYISLPAQRFAELVKKYAHHIKMQQIG